eukprot:Protomagalhaensia_sp_Gyna_25__2949@NODE_2732_length_921_cov_55_308390_g2278_i0_p1_GENE_NODE_2732_length_921_cov_55_308390_g2278_i0NODE_2732_length_921_cov_55_308390_g2278_i0_p1_ORF_typecomplete_len244_score52_97AAA_23/PF13476_6/0_028Nup88/PF10168_9/0_084CDCA/PF18484_1/0_15_NODE_2732_length_921_cov_55_308390_g2278_i085816
MGATKRRRDSDSDHSAAAAPCQCDCGYCKKIRHLDDKLERAWRRAKRRRDGSDSDASGIEAAKRGAVSDRFGKYGLINDGARFAKRAEFQLWLAEIKGLSYEEVSQPSLKALWSQFVEDFNTATFPSKKYYELAAWERRSARPAPAAAPPAFNDEECRRQELTLRTQRDRERQLDEAYQTLRTDTETLEAMKRQKELKTRMDYLFKMGKIEQAREIQSLLRAEDRSGNKDRGGEISALSDEFA